MLFLSHLLQLSLYFPTVGELPSLRGDDASLLFNPPVEHKFPSILSIDAPLVVLTLDGPPPPALIHPTGTQEPTYSVALKSSVRRANQTSVHPPPSYDLVWWAPASRTNNLYQHFGYFLVLCFVLFTVSHYLQDLTLPYVLWAKLIR